MGRARPQAGPGRAATDNVQERNKETTLIEAISLKII
jgi:hypothetical protein